VTALFIFFQIFSLPSLLAGLILLSLSLLVTVGEYRWGVFGRHHEDASHFRNQTVGRVTSGQIVSLVSSVIGIILGGAYTVIIIERISLLTGYSTAFLGLSLSAVATSLPELITTILSQKKHEEKITLGNIIGSNIYNLLFIGGVSTLASASAIPLLDWIWLVITTLTFVFLIRFFCGRVVPKAVGVLLLAAFLAYLIFH